MGEGRRHNCAVLPYLNGLGVCQDFERAAFWTERAARHGDWDAQYNLGTFYEQGIGVTADLEQAKLWYQAAARQGHTLAQQKCEALFPDHSRETE